MASIVNREWIYNRGNWEPATIWQEGEDQNDLLERLGFSRYPRPVYPGEDHTEIIEMFTVVDQKAEFYCLLFISPDAGNVDTVLIPDLPSLMQFLKELEVIRNSILAAYLAEE